MPGQIAIALQLRQKRKLTFYSLLLPLVAVPNQFLWSLIGLLLTIGGTFVEAYITSLPISWHERGIQTISLGVTCQIGAVLLVGCLGGRNAAALSQIAYLVLGLAWLPIFAQGGGLSYWRELNFGYILGFIPGAWVCGLLAFRQTKLKLENLAASCLGGLLTIHCCGLAYLLPNQIFHWASIQAQSILQAALQYSFYPLPGQLAVVCAVAVIAYGWRLIMFY
jgi:biotin transport system substrate-specific component